MYLVPFDRPILTPELWEFWDENGYVMVPNAVPQEYLDAAVAAIWEFLEMDPDDPDTWYGYRPRMAQYITMDTSPPDEQELRTRVNAWQERIPIANPQGDPRGREKRQPVAALTELGRRLIGFTPWDEEPDAAAARSRSTIEEVT